MMSEEHVDIKAIFSAALELLPGEARAEYLVKACGGNVALHAKVQELLAAEAAMGSFLDQPAVASPQVNQSNRESDATFKYLPNEHKPGQLIGRYKLLQQIGEGGFGVVFMAEQTEPVRRQVALKVIKPGMDSQEVIARFEAERQALALMDHTNIARVFDAGTTASGRPYFVMELVKGLPITEYCDEYKLDTCARLRLFIPVCQAVQHAHQKGVIHRDLKPMNVLVTLFDGTPVPKVIDFGIAKATSQKLTEKTLFTAFGQCIGTPQYMSPEQSALSALDIDTRADIYALGATLYELLSGSPPFDPERLRSAGFAEMLRIIREEEPDLPSRRLSTLGNAATNIAQRRQTLPEPLGRSLRGDLDWIVMKAIEKDRNRRYGTPGDLAADIQRHLNLEPIQARPIAAWNRHWRWCRRNPVVASLVATLLLVFVAGFMGVVYQWRRAEIAVERETLEREEAERQRILAGTQADLAQQRAEESRQAALVADQQAEKASTYLYAAQMNLAQRAWDGGQVAEVSGLLNETKPVSGQKDRRSFEWYYLTRLCDSHLASFSMGSFGVGDLAYSPDGQLLAAASYRLVKVWSVRDQKQLHAFAMRGHAQCVAFSPDSSQLISADGTGNLEYETAIKLWDLQSSEKRTVARCTGGISQLIFSPDGEFVAGAITFSPITVIVSKEDELRSGEIKVWRVNNGDELYTIGFTLPKLDDRSKVYARATEAPAVNLAFSPDGSRLAGVTGFGRVMIWDAKNGTELMNLNGGGSFVAFSSEGQTIISGDMSWKVSDGIVVSQVPGNAAWKAIEGKRAAAVNGSIVTVSDVESHNTIATLRLRGANAPHVAISPDGWRIATSRSREITTWDAQGSQETLTLRHPVSRRTPLETTPDVNAVTISADGQRIATAVGGNKPFSPAKVYIWDRIIGQPLIELSEDATHCTKLTFSRDGRLLAASFFGEGTVIWDSRSGELLHRFPHEGHDAALSPDGRTIATTGQKDRKATIHLRDTSTGEVTGQPDIDWYSVDHLAFHPDGKQIALCGRRVWEQPGHWKESDVIAIYDVNEGRVILTQSGPLQSVTCIQYRPDGEMLAVASHKAVHALHPHTLEEIATLNEGATNVAFSPDGRRLLTNSIGTLRVRDVESWQEVLRLQSSGSGLAFDAIGQFLVTGGRSSDVNRDISGTALASVWDLRPVSNDDKVQREAIGIVRYLASQSLSEEDVEQKIQQDRTISTMARQLALELWRNHQLSKSMVRAGRQPLQED